MKKLYKCLQTAGYPRSTQKPKKNNANLIEQIRTKVNELENQNWKIDFKWVKAHAGNHGNELADKLAKEAATSTEKESYKKIPKNTEIRELNEVSLVKWQKEWDKATKGQTTQDFIPVIQDRLKAKINSTPIFTTMTTGHGNLKSYVHRFKIIELPTCPCGTTEQTIDHLIFRCELLGKERDKLILGVAKTDNWSITRTD
jgi:hypothetical protein